jgi:channel protein (hemolysin III family)
MIWSLFSLWGPTFLILGLVYEVCHPWGWIVFGVVWAGCILGIVMNSINIKKYDKLSMVIYVVIGSAIIAAFYPLWHSHWLGRLHLITS